MTGLGDVGGVEVAFKQDPIVGEKGDELHTVPVVGALTGAPAKHPATTKSDSSPRARRNGRMRPSP